MVADSPGARFTIAEAIRAFQTVRGNTPKPDVFTDEERERAFYDASGRLFVADTLEEIPPGAIRLVSNTWPASSKP
jgi:hypothetical protein